jgi:hypothetical protein
LDLQHLKRFFHRPLKAVTHLPQVKSGPHLAQAGGHRRGRNMGYFRACFPPPGPCNRLDNFLGVLSLQMLEKNAREGHVRLSTGWPYVFYECCGARVARSRIILVEPQRYVAPALKMMLNISALSNVGCSKIRMYIYLLYVLQILPSFLF